jgi:hypothetical protein
LFEEGISPEWEDPRNKDGKIFTLEYRIDTGIESFLRNIEKAWLKLILALMGETLVGSKFVFILNI